MTAIDLFSLYALFSQYWSLANTLEFRTFCGEGRNTSSPKNACMGSLPADVLWGSFVTQRNECVTNEPQRTSSGRLLRGMLFIDRFFLF